MKQALHTASVEHISPSQLQEGIMSLWSQLPKLRTSEKTEVEADIRRIWQSLYHEILFPEKDNLNMGAIYRIGTFMTYLIQNNHARYIDDSLITIFEGYFYDQDPEVTIDRMKQLDVKYLLVDLNAATIDRDPRRALTSRYEHLLSTLRSRKLSLIATDSICLRFALDQSRYGKITHMDEYLILAGTNHDGNARGVTPSRNEKFTECANRIYETILSDEQVATRYPYLKTLAEYAKKWDHTALSHGIYSLIGQSWFALFAIESPEDSPTITSSPDDSQR